MEKKINWGNFDLQLIWGTNFVGFGCIDVVVADGVVVVVVKVTLVMLPA